MIKRLKNANTHLRRLNTLRTMMVQISLQNTIRIFPGIKSLKNMNKVLELLNAKFGSKYYFDHGFSTPIYQQIYVFPTEESTNAPRTSEFIHTKIFPAAVAAICTIMREKGYVAEPARPRRPDQYIISFYQSPKNRNMF